MNTIPFIPEGAPFSPEQRAWLNGFFAGIYSRTAPISSVADPAPGPRPLAPLTILFGSQTGTAEGLARKIASEAGKRGFAPSVIDMAEYSCSQLKNEKALLIVTSTHGDGDPPDNAKGFWEFLGNGHAPRLEHVQYSVLALGDTNYAKFCECGKNFDRRLEELGARRIFPRVDCDVDYDEPFRQWLNGVLPALSSRNGDAPVVAVETSAVTEKLETWSRKNPFPARLLTNKKLSGPGSAKDTRHFEISLEDSGLQYEVGDALGVVPDNCPALAGELLSALGCDGEEAVADADGRTTALRKALLTLYEITRIPRALMENVAERSGDGALKKLLEPGSEESLRSWLWGREIVDLLRAFSNVRFEPEEFIGLLKKLPPRLYSISSSPKAHPGQVHLTVAAVRYAAHGRERKGVCSTFLADRVSPETPLPIFIHTNRNFRPPADGNRPVVMVGPGTGVAPFRAFLEERRATGARGKNWLFFGDQRESADFLYRDELTMMLENGVLTRLHTAFSRDQEEKIYVQHRMLENASEIFAWLEEGASFYVCGDASRIDNDFDSALNKVIEQGGGRTAEAAADYVKKLQAEKRYQRDVY